MVEQCTIHPNITLAATIQVGQCTVHCPFRNAELYYSYIFHFLFVLMEFSWEKGYWVARNVTPVYSSWAIADKKGIHFTGISMMFLSWNLSLLIFNFVPSTLHFVCISILSVTLFKLSTRPFINLVLVMHVKSSYEMIYKVNIPKKIELCQICT